MLTASQGGTLIISADLCPEPEAPRLGGQICKPGRFNRMNLNVPYVPYGPYVPYVPYHQFQNQASRTLLVVQTGTTQMG